MKHIIRNCYDCGGEVVVDSYDEKAGIARITEIHKKDCPVLKEWGKVVGSHGTI